MCCGNRYKKLELLGKGGNGIVYLALDKKLDRKVAMKIISLDGVNQRIFWKNLQTLSLLKTSIFPTIYDAYVEEDVDEDSDKEKENGKCNVNDCVACNNVDIDVGNDKNNGANMEKKKMKYKGIITMEYIDGITLQELLKRREKLSLQQVLKIGEQLALFLKELHSQNPMILYRDLKPANIIIQENGIVRLVDMGTIGYSWKGRIEENMRIGTFGYCAPEQWNGKGVDRRCDIYSLGVVLSMMLLGVDKPVSAAALKCISMENSCKCNYKTDQVVLQNLKKQKRAENQESLKKLKELLLKSMAINKEERYPSIEAFLQDFYKIKEMNNNENEVNSRKFFKPLKARKISRFQGKREYVLEKSVWLRGC